MKRGAILFVITAFVCAGITFGQAARVTPFASDFDDSVERTWLGPVYWSNPMQDWGVANGRIECVQSGGDRNVFLLTRHVDSRPGDLKMSVTIGRLNEDGKKLTEGYVGFKTGIQGEFDDYRDSAVRGDGFRVGMYTGGRLFVGRYDETVKKIEPPFQDITLTLEATPVSEDAYEVTLTATDKDGKQLSQAKRDDVAADWLHGGVALVCSNGKVKDMPEKRPTIDNGNWGFRQGTGRGGNVLFWFADWKVAGTKVDSYPQRAWGPILWSQYTLSENVLNLTAQMAPIGEGESQEVGLQTKGLLGWQTVAEAEMDPLSRTAEFKVKDWNDGKDTPYRVAYTFTQTDGTEKEVYFEGEVRENPKDKENLVVAGFTGNNDLGFPNNDFVKSVAWHDPDVLFFSGDQIYEGVGGYRIQTSPLEKAAVDYLRKWYLYGWAYKDLLKDRPSVAIPDDHDVYHGNIWGAGGKATPEGTWGAKAQDAGGYKMPPVWVNMVQRTQTSHLPDPYDPTPVKQGIGVYYTNMVYGGVDFAIIEDRKFKSAPRDMLPKAEIYNGWPQNPDFDAEKEADIEGAKLLGERQLAFLNDWATDWSHGERMKCVLSQTIFANVATLPEDEMSDAAVPRLRILDEGEYPPNDAPVSDFDSNGWPQRGRNEALRAIRKGLAFHIAGDQHLGSTIEYGIDEYRDAGFAVCVPSVSNVWPRRWYPQTPSENRIPGEPRYTGDFEDGFGNKITVYAVSNPTYTGLKPSRLYDRATGYGIVRFNRESRDIKIEMWPRLSDPSEGGEQYPGWPITISQFDNNDRTPWGYLPTVDVTGMDDPVVKVVDESSSEAVYAVRIKGTRWSPPVYESGSYTIMVGEPADGDFRSFPGIKAGRKAEQRLLKIKF
ncbi:PhoD-like phosphatase [Anaerohalosphaera lusitana]|uniref:PhoD-like phosphatase n=1 Tax=Anaerohalosphaera lusitana TaxID=1936003 RepID=A0A1U9NN48_9BACT|nr:alkaline phosphatase D family protein [Anaerohalosphaera lusitana]AQT69331.1 PhoD-like phosphatase [Anaerohalosphaera lusitana]